MSDRYIRFYPGDLVEDCFGSTFYNEAYGTVGIVLRRTVDNGSGWKPTYRRDDDYVYDVLFVDGQIKIYHSMNLKKLT